MFQTEREAEAALEGLSMTMNPETASEEVFSEEHLVPLMVYGNAIEMGIYDIPFGVREWFDNLSIAFLDAAMEHLIKTLKEDFLPIKGRMSDVDKMDLNGIHQARLALIRAGFGREQLYLLNPAHNAEYSALWAELQGQQ